VTKSKLCVFLRTGQAGIRWLEKGPSEAQTALSFDGSWKVSEIFAPTVSIQHARFFLFQTLIGEYCVDDSLSLRLR
jgi:hypothetical protein